MTTEAIIELEQNALALRKIADLVLKQVREVKATAPARAKRNKKQTDGVADLKARILTGHIKPRK
ncbi:hypothetical protein [Chitinophaga sp. CF418]|uniref:hypothetical protein n=1 Tax=Chitinophaga sp. CF418 TaxID=1855287 RepID=UPI0009152A6E|nr:hypothetical protein [Chitinophaga sp. CF418]SHL87523.1 hypothetical protein SAMN05216311_1015 [Chitinophaga sp. CF418]